jgi:hypothetical protein
MTCKKKLMLDRYYSTPPNAEKSAGNGGKRKKRACDVDLPFDKVPSVLQLGLAPLMARRRKAGGGYARVHKEKRSEKYRVERSGGSDLHHGSHNFLARVSDPATGGFLWCASELDPALRTSTALQAWFGAVLKSESCAAQWLESVKPSAAQEVAQGTPVRLELRGGLPRLVDEQVPA